MTDSHRETMGFPLPRLNQFDFHPRLADMTGTSLIMFTSPDCGACRHLRKVLAEVHLLEPDWRLFEVDAQRDSALSNEFEIFHLPTLILYRDGNFHCQLQAEAQPSSIIRETHAAQELPAEEAP